VLNGPGGAIVGPDMSRFGIITSGLGSENTPNVGATGLLSCLFPGEVGGGLPVPAQRRPRKQSEN
jgi:hypothetical protein